MSINEQGKAVGYGKGAKILHWIIVLLVIVQFISAWTMPSLRGASSPSGLVSLHLSFGTLVLFVMLIRVVWRITHRPPDFPLSLTRFQMLAARAVHHLLYALLIALPFSGWAWASSRGWDATLFGVMKLPALLSLHSSYGRVAGNLHSSIATIVLVIIGAHVGAALYHYYVKNDGVMEHMLLAK